MIDFSHARAIDADKAARVFAAPPPDWTVAEHAEKRRYLSPETTHLHGLYRFDVTPFWREPCELYMRENVGAIIVLKSTQVGYSDLMNNIICYTIDIDPCGMLTLFPAKEDAEDWSKEKWTPMLRDSVCLHGKVYSRTKKDGTNSTNTAIRFVGGILTLAWSGSDSRVSQKTRKRIFIEEPDRCAANSKEGDSIERAIRRSDTFPDAKLLMGGSPTISGASAILTAMKTTDWRRYHIPCPHCGFFQWLDSSLDDDGFPVQLKWERQGGGDRQVVLHEVYGDALPETAYLQCANPGCSTGRITNDERNAALADGHWVPTRAFRGQHGYEINGLYSPMPKQTLAHGAERFLVARQRQELGDDSKMRVWVNTYAGRGYSPPAAEEIKPESIKRLRENFNGIVPAGVHYITCAVDPGGRRMDVEFVGWGDADESWGLKYETLQTGMEDDNDVSDMLENLEQLMFETEFHHETGVVMKAAAFGVDTGSYTTALYNWIKHLKRKKHRQHVYALKGQAASQSKEKEIEKQQWIYGSKSVLKQHGLWLYIVGSDALKLVTLRRLNRFKPGPGYMHISRDYPEHWETGMTSNKLYWEWRAGEKVYFFKKDAWERDEELDVRVYNTAIRHKDRVRLGELPKPTIMAENLRRKPTPQPDPPVQRSVYSSGRSSGWARRD